MRVYEEGDRVVNLLGPHIGYWTAQIYEAKARKRGRGLIWKIVKRLGQWRDDRKAKDAMEACGLPCEPTANHNSRALTAEDVVLDILNNTGI